MLSADEPGRLFDEIERAAVSLGPPAALDLLAREFLRAKRYPELFETRLMRKRLELELPVIQLGGIEDLPEPARARYEDGVREAAREAGSLFLADGDIAHAWPYFRAIGDRETIAAALESAEPGGQIDALIEIAWGERVHPRKGLELIIARHGVCRAISYCEQFSDLEDRAACLALLVRTMHCEVAGNLKHAIAAREGQAPASNRLAELVAGRDWLFGDFDTYADTLHVINVIRFAVDLEDRDAILLALDLCEYGAHLSPQFGMRGEPPFEDIYRDHAIYLRALLGEDLEGAVGRFKEKITAQEDAMAAIACAQILIALLVRHERYRDAVQVSLDHLSAVPSSRLACPSVFQLCHLAGDPQRIKELARQRGDLISFAAGVIQI